MTAWKKAAFPVKLLFLFVLICLLDLSLAVMPEWIPGAERQELFRLAVWTILGGLAIFEIHRHLRSLLLKTVIYAVIAGLVWLRFYR